LKARNWNGVLVMLHEVTEPSVLKKAHSALIRWLKQNAETNAISQAVADFRLHQLTEILRKADRDSKAFTEMKKAVETYQQQAKPKIELTKMQPVREIPDRNPGS
jgi:hypothetical protein